MIFKKQINFIQSFFVNWSADKVSQLAAALSYFMTFSLAPILIICIAVAGFVLEKQEVQTHIIDYFSGTMGKVGGEQIKTMIEGANKASSSFFESLIALGILVFGASGFFGELQNSLNTVWGVKPKPGRGILGIIKDRFFSFTLVMGVAFLLLVSLLVNIFISAAGDYINHYVPSGEIVSQTINFIISLGLTTLLFGLILKIIPDVVLRWRDVLGGAFFTAILFTLGKFALATYLGQANFASAFGAAGSMIIILVWVYYSAQILLLGAEFTKVSLLTLKKRKIIPTENAMLN